MPGTLEGPSELASVTVTVTTTITVVAIVASGACVAPTRPFPPSLPLSLVFLFDPRADPWLEQVDVINPSCRSAGTEAQADSLEQAAPCHSGRGGPRGQEALRGPSGRGCP